MVALQGNEVNDHGMEYNMDINSEVFMVPKIDFDINRPKLLNCDIYSGGGAQNWKM